MKRYVIELATDMMKKGVSNDAAETIRDILQTWDGGFITDAEAIYLISKEYLGFE